MKPILAALAGLLALSPAYAQNRGTPCTNPDGFGGSDKAWKAAFDSVELGYGALTDDKKRTLTTFLQAQDHPNAACAAPKGGSAEECGAFVDHLMLAKKHVSKQPSRLSPSVLSWRDPAGETLFSDAAMPIYTELCGMQAERAPGRANSQKAGAAAPPDGAQQAQRQVEVSKRMLANAEQWRKGLGGSDTSDAPAENTSFADKTAGAVAYAQGYWSSQAAASVPHFIVECQTAQLPDTPDLCFKRQWDSHNCMGGGGDAPACSQISSHRTGLVTESR